MTITFGPHLGIMVGGARGDEHYNQLVNFLRGIDLLVMGAVKSVVTALPTTGMADGDSYIYTTADSNKDKLARYSTVLGTWEWFVPRDGWWFRVLDQLDENGQYMIYVYDTTAGWTQQLASGGLTEAQGDARYEAKVKSNLSATTNPTATDDSTQGYTVLSRWVNVSTNEMYTCVNASPGAANWQQATLTLDELGSAALANVGNTGTLLPTATMVNQMIANYAAFTGSSAGGGGVKGMVPAPPATEVVRYLASDGTWRVITIQDVPAPAGENIGGGAGFFFRTVDSTLQFKTLVSSDNSVQITVNEGTIDITTDGGSGGGSDFTFENVGLSSGVGVLKGVTSGDAVQFKRLKAGTNVTLDDDGNTITVSATPGSGGGDDGDAEAVTYTLYGLAYNSGNTEVVAVPSSDWALGNFSVDVTYDTATGGVAIVCSDNDGNNTTKGQLTGFVVQFDYSQWQFNGTGQLPVRITLTEFTQLTSTNIDGSVSEPYNVLARCDVPSLPMNPEQVGDMGNTIDPTEVPWVYTGVLDATHTAIGFFSGDKFVRNQTLNMTIELQIDGQWVPFNNAEIIVPEQTTVIQSPEFLFVVRGSDNVPVAMTEEQLINDGYDYDFSLVDDTWYELRLGSQGSYRISGLLMKMKAMSYDYQGYFIFDFDPTEETPGPYFLQVVATKSSAPLDSNNWDYYPLGTWGTYGGSGNFPPEVFGRMRTGYDTIYIDADQNFGTTIRFMFSMIQPGDNTWPFMPGAEFSVKPKSQQAIGDVRFSLAEMDNSQGPYVGVGSLNSKRDYPVLSSRVTLPILNDYWVAWDDMGNIGEFDLWGEMVGLAQRNVNGAMSLYTEYVSAGSDMYGRQCLWSAKFTGWMNGLPACVRWEKILLNDLKPGIEMGTPVDIIEGYNSDTFLVHDGMTMYCHGGGEINGDAFYECSPTPMEQIMCMAPTSNPFGEETVAVVGWGPSNLIFMYSRPTASGVEPYVSVNSWSTPVTVPVITEPDFAVQNNLGICVVGRDENGDYKMVVTRDCGQTFETEWNLPDYSYGFTSLLADSTGAVAITQDREFFIGRFDNDVDYTIHWKGPFYLYDSDGTTQLEVWGAAAMLDSGKLAFMQQDANGGMRYSFFCENIWNSGGGGDGSGGEGPDPVQPKFKKSLNGTWFSNVYKMGYGNWGEVYVVGNSGGSGISFSDPVLQEKFFWLPPAAPANGYYGTYAYPAWVRWNY